MKKFAMSLLLGMLLGLQVNADAYLSFASPNLTATRDAKIANFKLPNTWLVERFEIFISTKNPGIFPMINYTHRGAVRIAQQYVTNYPYKPMNMEELLAKDKFFIAVEDHYPRTEDMLFSIYTIARDGDTWVSEMIFWTHDIFRNQDSKFMKRKSITRGGVTKDYIAVGQDLKTMVYREMDPEEIDKKLSEKQPRPKHYSEYYLRSIKSPFEDINKAGIAKNYTDNVTKKDYKYKGTGVKLDIEKNYYSDGDRLILVRDRSIVGNDDVQHWYFIKGYTDEFNIEDVIRDIESGK